jgi:ribonuclease PH
VQNQKENQKRKIQMKIDINEYAEGAVLLDGFEDCMIGITQEFGNGPRILYSKEKILQNLMEMGMTHLEAEEYYDFNILGLYVSEQNPIFLEISL